MKVEIIRGSITHSGKEYEVGDTIKQISASDGERLIELGVAKKYVEPSEDDSDTGDGTPEGDQTPDGTNKTPSEKNESEKTQMPSEDEE